MHILHFLFLFTFCKISSQNNNNETYNLEIFYEKALNLTKQAGAVIKEKISSNSKLVQEKTDDIDLVTETDQQIERFLIDGLSSQFPDHKFFGEESVANGTKANLTNSPTWIIDPIDGTMNFVHTFPHSCVSIALLINKKPVIGIIYNPMLNQLFTAKKGKGAFLNGKEIKVSGKKTLSNALVMMEFGISRDPEKYKVVSENQKILMPLVHGLRSLGSSALSMAMVACGAADIYFEHGMHIWDVAAGELMVTEAGGVVIDPSGGDFDRLSRRIIAAGSQELALKLSEKIVQFYPTPRD